MLLSSRVNSGTEESSTSLATGESRSWSQALKFPASTRGGAQHPLPSLLYRSLRQQNAFGEQLGIKEVLMGAEETKSSKCRRESGRNSSGGINPSSPAHLHAVCSSERVGRGMQNLKGFFPPCFPLQEEIFEGESCFMTSCYLFSRHPRHAAQLECFCSCLCNVDVSAEQPWAGKLQFPESKQQLTAV